MSILSGCSRTIKRRLLFIFFGVCGTLLLVNRLLSGPNCLLCSSEEGTILHLRKLSQPFNWDSEEETDKNRTSEFAPSTCRNSLQGKNLVADDRGFVCTRTSLLGTGCCNANESLGQHDCTSCDLRISCCTHYEFCISCCLRKEQKPALQQFLKQAAEKNNVLFFSVSDHFELCLAKCRTSSSSVQHENTYRNKSKKYCYGKDAPPTSSTLDND